MDTETVRATEIAKKNDECRKGYTLTLTRGVQALPDVLEVLEMVRKFNDFGEDNDPYGEHDFGSFECFGEKLFWKIDYYDSALELWADPTSNECHRVLTVMLAEEY